MLDILRQGAQSWGIKILFGIIIAVFVLAFGMNRMHNDKTTVVATVNDAPIHLQHFQERLQRNLEMIRRQNPNVTSEMLAQMGFKRQILDQMVGEELMLQQAATLGLSVSKEELAKQIHLIPAFQKDGKLFDPETYQNVLRANNLTPGKFESEYMRSMLMDKLQAYLSLTGRLGEEQARDYYDYGRSTAVIAYLKYPWEKYKDQVNATEEKIAEQYAARKDAFAVPAKARVDYIVLTPGALADTASVTDQEARAYYDQHKDNFKIEEQVQARHILVRVDENATEADVAKAMDTIKKAQADLKAGKSFEETVAKYTEDPSGTQTGGELGWFGRGRMVKPFEDAAFALDKGAVSEPVRTQFGFHLIKVEDKKAAGFEDFASVADTIRRSIAEDRATETLQDRLDQALEMVLIGDSLDAVAKTLGIEVRTTDSFTREQGPVELAALSPENTATLFDLAQNATTQSPVPFEDGYVLATKREQLDASVQPLDAVRESIVATIVREEAMKLAKADADADLALLMKGEAPSAASNATAMETEPFGRQGSIPGLGANQMLSEKAFMAPAGAWIPESFAFPTGYVLAKPVKVVPPTPEEWAAEKDLWVSTLNERTEGQAMQAFMADLRAKADVRLTNPALLDN
ncbi:peptidylprolyl isomerase [Desulfomicrobium salsuginis]